MTPRLGTRAPLGTGTSLGTLAAMSLLAALPLLAGCSHGSSSAPRSAATVHGASPASEPPQAGAFDEAPRGAAEGAPAPAAGAPASEQERASREDDGEVARSKSRPGLGTSWGEARESGVSRTSFTRASGDSPFATTAFFYNDEAGANAMAGGRSVDWGDSVVPVRGGSVVVSLTDAHGSPLRAARVDGRTIAVGNDGDRYVIRVDNRSPFRLETVASVDGLDVVDGDDGSLHKRGYVLAPHDTLDIEGFRESAGSVRAFRFGSVKDSYAERRSKGRNVGVVGVALFEEQGTDWRWTPEEVEHRSTAKPFPGSFAPAPPRSPLRTRE